MNCQVSVIVNDVKPYQKAAGNTSEANYSSWNYILTPHYTSIKQGINKLTAKLSCNDNFMNVTKFYSINITGVKSTYAFKISVAKTNRTKNEIATPLQAKQFTTASTALPVKQLSSSVNGILTRTGIISARAAEQDAPRSDTNSTTVQSEKHHHLRTTTTEETRTVSAEAHLKKHHQEKTATPTTAVNSPIAISTTWSGVGNVAIPPTINGTIGKVTIPKQAVAGLGLNNTIGQQQQSNANTPFVFGPQSSPSRSFVLNNNHQSLQPSPIANPGPNQVVVAGSPVILNGSGSRAPGGIILSYSWRQIPTNAVITLSGVGTPVWEFTAPNVSADTLLRFQLNVTDNLGQTGTSIVNILDKPGFTFNTPPRTPIMKSPYATEIMKSPYASSRYATEHPSINLNKVPTTNPTIPPPLIPPVNSQFSPQAYNGAQTPFHGYPPIANAGHDQVVNANSIVTLVGSLSKDPNGEPLSYHWTQIGGSQATTLSVANTPVWEFTAPNVASDTKLTFQLTVTDSHGLSDSGRVVVLVLAPAR